MKGICAEDGDAWICVSFLSLRPKVQQAHLIARRLDYRKK